MDKSKLNEFALKIAEDVMEVKRSLPLSGALGAVNYKLSNIASQMHLFVDTLEGYGETPAGIYALTLMNSGAGKGASLKLIDRTYLEDAFSKIRDTVYPVYRNKAIKRFTDVGLEEPIIRAWTPRVETATMSGVSAVAESYYTVGFGGVNIEMDEVADSIMSEKELFDKLLKTYDNGDYPATAKRTDPNPMDIKKMPTNLYCFGNKVKLTDGSNIQNEFMSMLDKGYARRMIFVDDNTVKKPRTPQEVLDDMDKGQDIYSRRTAEREYVADIINIDNFKRTMTLDRDARYAIAVIRAEGEQYVSEHPKLEEAIQGDMMERAFKTAKLAAVYAFFDGNDKVTAKNIEEAFEVVKESSKVLKELRKVKPLEERLLDALLRESESITSQTMLNYNFINSTWTKKILEYINLAKELASTKGYEWVEDTKNGVTYYQVIDDLD